MSFNYHHVLDDSFPVLLLQLSQDINMLHKHKEIAHIRYVRVI